MTKPVKRHKVKITVKRVTVGACPLGMKPGRTWIVDKKTPGGICLSALNTLLPYLRAQTSGGTFYYQKGFDAPLEYSCPDHVRHVIFEIERVKE
ncbi:MAG: TIGR04076 family protein [Chloroflexi bacterium]|nr:TIGR04076 family protein [Chloroflexota bacterium]